MSNGQAMDTFPSVVECVQSRSSIMKPRQFVCRNIYIQRETLEENVSKEVL